MIFTEFAEIKRAKLIRASADETKWPYTLEIQYVGGRTVRLPMTAKGYTKVGRALRGE